MSECLIQANGVRYSYGKKEVLHGLDLEVPRGSIFGFLGRNGAGKSTLIRLLAGFSAPTGGSVRVLGHDPLHGPAEMRQQIGYLAEGQVLPVQMRVSDLLHWTSQLYPRWDDEVVRRLIAKFDLDVTQRISKLSQGQQRQVGFLLAVAPQPDLLILDEPAATLDTVARRVLLDEMLGLLREGNKTVFFSTHILSDVERVADQVAILNEGRLLVNESLDYLKKTVCQVRFFWDRTDSPLVPASGVLQTRRGRGETLVTLRLESEEQAAQLATAQGCRYEIRTMNLEELFVELTQNQGEQS